MTKIAFSKAKKIAMKFFGPEMTPPPLSEILRKFIRFGRYRLPLVLGFHYCFCIVFGFCSELIMPHFVSVFAVMTVPIERQLGICKNTFSVKGPPNPKVMRKRVLPWAKNRKMMTKIDPSLPRKISNF